MKGLMLLSLALISAVLISGCIQQPVCNKPYILVGTSCCLDTNNNDICDSDDQQAIGQENEEITGETIKECMTLMPKFSTQVGYVGIGKLCNLSQECVDYYSEEIVSDSGGNLEISFEIPEFICADTKWKNVTGTGCSSDKSCWELIGKEAKMSQEAFRCVDGTCQMPEATHKTYASSMGCTYEDGKSKCTWCYEGECKIIIE